MIEKFLGDVLSDHAGLATAGQRVRAAVADAFADGAIELDANGSPARGTRAATEAVTARLAH